MTYADFTLIAYLFTEHTPLAIGATVALLVTTIGTGVALSTNGEPR